MDWVNISVVEREQYQCGFCEKHVAPSNGYFRRGETSYDRGARIYICPNCDRPTYKHHGFQVPGVAYGNQVNHLPKDIEQIYNEARKCIGIGAYTSSLLACRKVLMNIAVAEGAKKGKQFAEYIDFLDSKNYIPPKGRGWVDMIRKQGNEAAHEIVTKTQDEAEQIINFTEMLLKFIYEFSALCPEPSE